MAFLTDAELLGNLADALKKSAPLQPQWSGIVGQAHSWAYAWIVTALLAKGFLKAQIDAWDFGGQYERELTIWKALSRGGALENYDDKFVKTFDVREELMALSALSISGVWTPPTGTAGTVRTGLPNVSDDLFVYPDPDDVSDRGQVIRW